MHTDSFNLAMQCSYNPEIGDTGEGIIPSLVSFALGRVRTCFVASAIIVAVTACAVGPVPQLSQERPKLTGGAWVLSGAWQGYMGVAIQFFSDGTFHYWDYSDVSLVGEPPRHYPFAGRWRWDGSVLELTSKNDLHANRWHVMSYHGQLALLPEYAREWQIKDHKLHEDRLLFHIRRFDPKDPQLNYGGYEHADGSHDPVSP